MSEPFLTDLIANGVDPTPVMGGARERPPRDLERVRRARDRLRSDDERVEQHEDDEEPRHVELFGRVRHHRHQRHCRRHHRDVWQPVHAHTFRVSACVAAGVRLGAVGAVAAAYGCAVGRPRRFVVALDVLR